jgi:hypothetical protein
MKVVLYTQDGGFVHAEEIPPFHQTPEVVTWGQRVFRRRRLLGDKAPIVNDAVTYVEAWAYTLINGATPTKEE